MADPFTLALLAQAGAQGIGALAQGVSQYRAGKDLMLTDEQKRRLRELERLEALGQFGMTPAQREAYQAQALTPVQAAERQALAQFGASQAIGDIGQGAAFRQQQAIKEGSEESRAKIAQAVAEKEAQAAATQQTQLEALKDQERRAKQMQRDAALGALGGIAQAGAEAAGTFAEKEAMEDLYEKKLAQLSGTQQQTTNATRQMLGVGSPKDTVPSPEDTVPSPEDTGVVSREERDRQYEEALYAQDPAKYLSDLVDTPENGMDVDRTLRRMLGKGLGFAERGRSQTEYYDPTMMMGLTPNSELTEGERLDQLGQPPAVLPPVSGVQELSNVDQAAQAAQQDIVDAKVSAFPIGTEVKSAEGWGYRIIANDANGNPIWTFVKKNGTAVGRYGEGTPQYEQAFELGRQ